MRLTTRDIVGCPFCQSAGYLELLEKLAAYEDAEEQGRLVVLPCKVGDMVYYKRGYDILGDTVERIVVDGIDNQIILNAHRTFLFCDLGCNVFLTFEEAEAALKGETGDDCT